MHIPCPVLSTTTSDLLDVASALETDESTFGRTKLRTGWKQQLNDS
jgi:hypothetical protein